MFSRPVWYIPGPAVPPVSFVTLGDPDLVGGTVEDIPCCKDPNLATCVTADIKAAALGQKAVEWTDIALFAIFENLHIPVDQVDF